MKFTEGNPRFGAHDRVQMKVEEVLLSDPKFGKEASHPTFEIRALRYSTTKKWCYQLYNTEAQVLYMDGDYIEERLLKPDEQTEEKTRGAQFTQAKESGTISTQIFDEALRENEFVPTSPQPQIEINNKGRDLELLIPQRVEQNLVDKSGYEGDFDDRKHGNRQVCMRDPWSDYANMQYQKKPLYRINDEVQMDVIKHNDHGQEVQFAKYFFVHNRQYITESTKWVYQLNEAENGQAGAPWRQHRWVAERHLSPVL